MPITSVTAAVHTARLHTPFVTAIRTTSTVDSVIVSVSDDRGNTGRGEAAQTWRITGESLASVTACAEGPLRQAVLGIDADDLNAALNAADEAVVGNNFAKGALDTALHDLAAQRAGVSLVRWLGGSATRLPTDVTLPAGQIPDLVANATRRVTEGFRHLKVKVGTDPAGDIARLQAIRDAVGDDVTIRVDANQGWSAKEAIRITRGMENAGLGIELVEQPTPARRLDDLAAVTAAVDTPIVADESVHTVTDLLEVLKHRAADAVNIKLAKCGGLRAGRTMLEVSRQHGIGTMVGSMMEGRIGVAAAASLAAACGTTVTADLDAAWWLTEPDDALRYHDGTIELDAPTGLSAINFGPQPPTQGNDARE